MGVDIVNLRDFCITQLLLKRAHKFTVSICMLYIHIPLLTVHLWLCIQSFTAVLHAAAANFTRSDTQQLQTLLVNS